MIHIEQKYLEDTLRDQKKKIRKARGVFVKWEAYIEEPATCFSLKIHYLRRMPDNTFVADCYGVAM